jgi:hypothetical protein
MSIAKIVAPNFCLQKSTPFESFKTPIGAPLNARSLAHDLQRQPSGSTPSIGVEHTTASMVLPAVATLASFSNLGTTRASPDEPRDILVGRASSVELQRRDQKSRFALPTPDSSIAGFYLRFCDYPAKSAKDTSDLVPAFTTIVGCRS